MRLAKVSERNKPPQIMVRREITESLSALASEAGYQVGKLVECGGGVETVDTPV